MKGSPGFQNSLGRGGRASPANAQGMMPAIGDVALSEVTSA